MQEQIIIRVAGDSGDGVQLVGEQLTISAALAGRDVRSQPDFPAEIRAPLGTVAGVSGFQLAMAVDAIFTAGECVDVLVALNPAALVSSIEYLNQGGLLILNEDSMHAKDWEKAGASPDQLDSLAEHYQVITLPLIAQTLKAVESLDLTHTQSKKSKNFYILGVILWLFELDKSYCLAFIKQKFTKNAVIAEANARALDAGYNYALTLELSRKSFNLDQVARTQGEYRQITGIEGVSMAIAAVATTTGVPLFVSGYPITPASAILHACANLEDYGVNLLQAEDEIAAICACLGAAFGGRLALTCTSGPGLDLKSEGLGLAVVAELPLVVVDVQRAGPSTGLPTKTGQSDLNQALYGRHGEAPMPVIAAKSPADCFSTIIEAFSIAIKYMTPITVLLDAYLANGAEPWKIPDSDSLSIPKIDFNRMEKPFQRDAIGSRSWNIPGTPGLIHQLGGLEKQGDTGKVSYDAANHESMVRLRAKKINGIAQDYAPLFVEGAKQAQTLIISFGSTYGSVRTAVDTLVEEGTPIAFIHLRHINPLPNDLGELLGQYTTVLVAELNSGHLCQLLRARYLVDARLISQVNGQPFALSALIMAIKAEMDNG